MKKKTVTALAIPVLVIVTEKFTNESISSLIGKTICGDSYMEEIDGRVSELSCGFDTDMYLAMAMMVLFAIGLLMLFVDYIKKFRSKQAHKPNIQYYQRLGIVLYTLDEEGFPVRHEEES